MTPPEIQTFSKRVPELDGIRGVAILVVVLYHFVFLGGWSILPFKLGALPSLGWSGVDLFFVLSGFLIGGILLDAKDSENYFRVFYTRRAYRILPLYLVVCVVSLLTFYLHLPTHTWLFGGKTPWYAYLTFGQNFWMVKDTLNSRQIDVTWSLAVEEQFYLTLPFIIRFVQYRKLPYVLGAGVLLAPIIRTVLPIFLPHQDGLAFLAPCRMDALFLGVLAAYTVRIKSALNWLVTHVLVLRSAFAVLALGMLWVVHTHNRESVVFGALLFTWIAAFYVAILLLAVTQRGLVSKMFRIGPLTKLGVLAYGLYLFHQPILGLIYGIAGRDSPSLGPWPPQWLPLGLTCLSALLVLGLAYLSWIHFEKPLIQRGHEYRYHFVRVDNVTASYGVTDAPVLLVREPVSEGSTSIG